MKRLLLLVSLFCIGNAFPLESNVKKITKTRAIKKEAIDSDDLFNVDDESRLPAPVLKETSPFMGWIRARGIALLYWTVRRYQACKNWFFEDARSIIRKQESKLP